jgi:hypothetical protein
MIARMHIQKYLFAALLAICSVAVSSHIGYAAKAIPAGFSGGDGKSMKSAVIITYIGDYEKSIDQEYRYITGLFGARDQGWAFEEQELIQAQDKFYDKVTIKILFSREILSLYFDITEPHNALQRHLTNEN